MRKRFDYVYNVILFFSHPQKSWISISNAISVVAVVVVVEAAATPVKFTSDV